MKQINDTALTALLCGLIFLLCTFSKEAKEGALGGINMLETIIIPSLLPVLILSSLITKTRCSLVFEKLFGRITQRVFHLPKTCAAAVILGLTGGYPAGTLLTFGLYRDKKINAETAARLMRFNFCGGCAFIITAVGSSVYKSVKTGALLLLSCVLSSLITAFITRPKSRPYEETKARQFPRFYDALPEAAEGSVKAIALLGAYIVLFSAFVNIAKPPEKLMPLIEITSGICLAGSRLPLPVCAFFLSFGGLCIHMQLFGFLKRMNIKYSEFFIYRILNALLSYGIVKLYLVFFPESAEVFAGGASSAHVFTNGSMALSLVMITGCAVIIFDIENRKLKLNTP